MSIKSGQKSIQSDITDIRKRLEDVETKSDLFDHHSEEITSTQESVEELKAENHRLQSRLNELEDRSRRDNLIFYGLPDTQDTWLETEEKLTNQIKAVFESFPVDPFQRAHRLGDFAPNKCRPIVAMFTNFKMRDQVLSFCSQLKSKEITVNEDFSVATRFARKKLIDFAKAQQEFPKFKLIYDKLSINSRVYSYDTISDSIQELQARTAISANRSSDSSSAAV